MYKLIFVYFLTLNLYGSNFKELLFNGNCTTCHFINQAKSAPSIKEIQKVYKQAFPNKKDFIKYMSKFVLQPTEENSLMQNAISKYELMPELAFQEEALKDITSYIYDLEIK